MAFRSQPNVDPPVGTGLAFGAAAVVGYVLRKKKHTYVAELRFAIFMCLFGVVELLIFLIRPRRLVEQSYGALFVGFGATELYAHYKERRLKAGNKAPAP